MNRQTKNSSYRKLASLLKDSEDDFEMQILSRILDDYNSAATLFQVNGRNFHSHNLFTISSNIFPSDYVRAEDSDTGPLIHLITSHCDQNIEEITGAYG